MQPPSGLWIVAVPWCRMPLWAMAAVARPRAAIWCAVRVVGGPAGLVAARVGAGGIREVCLVLCCGGGLLWPMRGSWIGSRCSPGRISPPTWGNGVWLARTLLLVAWALCGSSRAVWWRCGLGCGRLWTMVALLRGSSLGLIRWERSWLPTLCCRIGPLWSTGVCLTRCGSRWCTRRPGPLRTLSTV